ncbi:T-complex protein 11 [Liparis tanakae]|uniref:T-complex protein 11 n=1 Tax=Liparis tanakae TaxID=230148 RepID=A0A4Z2G2X8_9TELE|nr:T-complex protein 11 [Liparis tanakae]
MECKCCQAEPNEDQQQRPTAKNQQQRTNSKEPIATGPAAMNYDHHLSTSSLDHTAARLQVAAADEAAGALSESSCLDVSATAALDRAFMRLLRWDPQDRKYPETVLMGRARLDALGRRRRALVLEASVLLLTPMEADLKEALPGVGDTALRLLTEAAGERGRGAAPPRESRSLLRGQISELWKHDHS